MSPVSPVSLQSTRRLATLCVVGFGLVIAVPPAIADDEDRFARPGAVGAAFVYAGDDYDDLDAQSGGTDDGYGGTFWMTYRFNQWVASQVRGDYIKGFEVSFGGDDVDTQYGQGTLGARLFPLAPFTESIDDRVEPFVDLTGGIGHVDRNLGGRADKKQYGFVARFAAGADVWLTASIGIELSAFYNLGTGRLFDYSYFGGTAGVTYRF